MTTSSRLISVGFVLAFVAGCNYSAQVATGADGGATTDAYSVQCVR